MGKQTNIFLVGTQSVLDTVKMVVEHLQLFRRELGVLGLLAIQIPLHGIQNDVDVVQVVFVTTFQRIAGRSTRLVNTTAIQSNGAVIGNSDAVNNILGNKLVNIDSGRFRKGEGLSLANNIHKFLLLRSKLNTRLGIA